MTNNINNFNNNDIIFTDKEGTFKLKEILKLDINGMIKRNDTSPLEPFLENMMYSDYEDNNLGIAPSEDVVLKIINDFQLIQEYLLYKQQSLENNSKVLENQYNMHVNKAMIDENELNENKLRIKALKSEIKLKENTIYAHKYLLEEHKAKRKRFSCQFCEGKVFQTEKALLSHFERRHKKNKTLNHNNMETDQSYCEEANTQNNFNKKFLDLTTNFENYMKTHNNDSFNKFMENQKNHEAKLIEIEKQRHHNETKTLEENFTKVLLELKELTQNNTSKEKESDKMNVMQNEMLNKQAAVMNSMLEEINKSNEEKMLMFQKQVEIMKNQLTEELGEFKNQSMKLLNKSLLDESARKHNLSITSNNVDLEILKQEKADVNNSLIQEAVINNSILCKKTRFNAGILEDDISEDEEHSFGKGNQQDPNVSVIESKKTNLLEIKEEIEMSFAAHCNTEKEMLLENQRKLQENVEETNEMVKKKDDHITGLVTLVNEMVSDLHSFNANANTKDMEEFKAIFDEIEAKSNLNKSNIQKTKKNNSFKEMSQIKDIFDKFCDRDELFVQEKLVIENYKDLM